VPFLCLPGSYGSRERVTFCVLAGFYDPGERMPFLCWNRLSYGAGKRVSVVLWQALWRGERVLFRWFV